MSTEYRRGIPSREHIEAATRLGLEWERTGQRWRFAIRNGEVWCDFLSHSMGWDSDLDLLDGGRIIARADAEAQSYRPIRTDGTPVDWEVLDAEVARVQEPIAGTVVGVNTQVRLNLNGTVSSTQPQAQPEPRRFADVRPDRHGWRWWRVWSSGLGGLGSRVEFNNGQFRWSDETRPPLPLSDLLLNYWLDHTVIPTDEQGNPVSWESIAQAAPTTTQPQPQGFRADLWSFSVFSQLAEIHSLIRRPQLWREALRQAASSTRTVVEIYRDLRREAHAAQARLDGQPSTKAFTTNPRSENSGESTPLPRFTTDELDDVDHSQSTKLDNTPLKRGKLPTAEQIGKYREVMARRSGTVAEALKASGIDCEVAQYVLDRWADGLSDETALWLLRDVGKYCRPGQSFTRARIDELAEQAIERPALDTSEPVDGTAQRQREEREAQRQRMAALQAQLAAERAALRAEPQPEPTRFDLLECDPEANPVASIAAWEARMAQRSVQRSVRQAPVQRPQPIPQPTHRRPFEVVDAQADGLTGGAALAVLLGRAMNGGC